MQKLEDLGIDVLTVHGRTKEQKSQSRPTKRLLQKTQKHIQQKKTDPKTIKKFNKKRGIRLHDGSGENTITTTRKQKTQFNQRNQTLRVRDKKRITPKGENPYELFNQKKPKKEANIMIYTTGPPFKKQKEESTKKKTLL